MAPLLRKTKKRSNEETVKEGKFHQYRYMDELWKYYIKRLEKNIMNARSMVTISELFIVG